MMNATPPLYQKVKNHIIAKVTSGEWVEGDRVPSEHELIKQLGVSRMTANRALRELTDQGFVRRVQGQGTFVAAPRFQSEFMEIRSIADDIEARGHRHSSEIIVSETLALDEYLATEMSAEVGDDAFHIILVHKEDDLPVQYEDRLVSPSAAPDFLSQDFTRITPHAHLIVAAPLEKAEHDVSAIIAPPEICKALQIELQEPCLELLRKTWSGGRVASLARLIYPGNRYRLHGAFAPGQVR